MRYQEVKWRHDVADDPIAIYSELDDLGWELRKVEEFRGGRLSWADGFTNDAETTGLSIEPIPTLSQINADPQFNGREITADEFEASASAC